MKDRNSQLNIIRNLIKEEIKLLKNKNQFSLNEDVTAAVDAVAATDATAMVKLGTPVLKVDKATNGITVYITNIKGYKSFSLKGFDELHNISAYQNPKTTDIEKDVIKFNYTVSSSSETIGVKRLIAAMDFKVTNNTSAKTVTLELTYKDKVTKPLTSVQVNIDINTPDESADFNKNIRIGVLHNRRKITESIELILPKGMVYDGIIGQTGSN